eukprot:3090159-Pyramimonas_sp.AAC.1
MGVAVLEDTRAAWQVEVQTNPIAMPNCALLRQWRTRVGACSQPFASGLPAERKAAAAVSLLVLRRPPGP